MPRRSTATVRRQPVEQATAACGSIAIYSETITIESRDRVEVIDLTDEMMARVHRWPVREGLVTLSSMHTTCTLFINEHQRALLADMKTFLEQIVRDDHDWLHNDPDHSDCDRANADAHLRALLLGHSLTLPVAGGEVVLGQWQRVLMGELDGPRTRSVRLQVMGITGDRT
jgi:secondary thiamine-phosphate synthase enzyme